MLLAVFFILSLVQSPLATATRIRDVSVFHFAPGHLELSLRGTITGLSGDVKQPSYASTTGNAPTEQLSKAAEALHGEPWASDRYYLVFVEGSGTATQPMHSIISVPLERLGSNGNHDEIVIHFDEADVGKVSPAFAYHLAPLRDTTAEHASVRKWL